MGDTVQQSLCEWAGRGGRVREGGRGETRELQGFTTEQSQRRGKVGWGGGSHRKMEQGEFEEWRGLWIGNGSQCGVDRQQRRRGRRAEEIRWCSVAAAG